MRRQADDRRYAFCWLGGCVQFLGGMVLTAPVARLMIRYVLLLVAGVGWLLPSRKGRPAKHTPNAAPHSPLGCNWRGVLPGTCSWAATQALAGLGGN